MKKVAVAIVCVVLFFWIAWTVNVIQGRTYNGRPIRCGNVGPNIVCNDVLNHKITYVDPPTTSTTTTTMFAPGVGCPPFNPPNQRVFYDFNGHPCP